MKSQKSSSQKNTKGQPQQQQPQQQQNNKGAPTKTKTIESIKQQPQRTPAMIATATAISASSNINLNDPRSVLGGVWIESPPHSSDDTVISEITSDHTAFTGDDAMEDLLCCFNNINTNTNTNTYMYASETNSFSTPPGVTSSNNNNNLNQKRAPTVMISPSTPSTVQSTPYRSGTTATNTSTSTSTNTSVRKGGVMKTERTDDGSFTDKPPSARSINANTASATKPAAKSATNNINNKKPAASTTAAPKAAPTKMAPSTATTTTTASKTKGTPKAAPTTTTNNNIVNSAKQTAPNPKTAAKAAPKAKAVAPVKKKAPPATTATTMITGASNAPAQTRKKVNKPIAVQVTPSPKTAPAVASSKNMGITTAKVPSSINGVGSNTATNAGRASVKMAPTPTVTATANKNNFNSPTTNINNNGAGLSELSKQLRVQRAKNEWQHQEIARLERQLRILSDLKGVSVADLRFSLESACQEEAHDELRNQVQSLQAQLEALQAQRESARRRASTATDEATQSKIATLQLRLGELEEVDQAKQAEVHNLYRQLQEQTARATTLEAAKAQQDVQLQKFEQVAKVYIQDVEKIQAERDALKEQVAELTQQLHDQQAARRLDQEMRDIEAQIQLEQQKKQEYLSLARKQKRAGVTSGGNGINHDNNNNNMTPVSRRISESQLAAIQGVVGRQAGVAPSRPANAATIATSVRGEEGAGSHYLSSLDMSAHSSVMTEEVDDVSQMGDDMDMSVQTLDALMMHGLSEQQAKEAVAKDAKIASLFQELREQTTKASQLQTLCANQKVQVERFAQEINEKDEVLKSTQSNYDFAKNEHDSLYKRFCDIELQLALEQDKVEGLERQLNARIVESDLRNDQFKCRFQVQNDRILDLEQQQQSLYAAFELLQQEVRAQDNEHSKLKSSLDEADHAVARQLGENEKNQQNARRSSRHLSSSPGTSQRNLVDDNFHSTPNAEPVPSVVASPVSPYASMDESNASYLLQEQTPQQQGIDHPMRMYGYLWKLDKIKGWKRRFFVLYGEGGVYQMTYADGPRERVKGTVNSITMGVSTVAETNKSIKKPFSFVLHVDPMQHTAPVLYLAAMTGDDFRKWMTALKAVTIRPEDSMYMSQPNLSQEAQIDADLEVARQMQSASSRDFNHDHESQIEADHLIAMRLHIQNQPNQAFA